MKAEPEIDVRVEGWTYLHNATKWHYFRDHRSLCGNWMLVGSPQLQDDMDSPDNCRACWRKRQKEIANAKVSA